MNLMANGTPQPTGIPGAGAPPSPPTDFDSQFGAPVDTSNSSAPAGYQGSSFDAEFGTPEEKKQAPAGNTITGRDHSTPSSYQAGSEEDAAAIAKREAQHPVITAIGKGSDSALKDAWDTVLGTPRAILHSLPPVQLFDGIQGVLPLIHAYEQARNSGKGVMDSLKIANDVAKKRDTTFSDIHQKIKDFQAHPGQSTVHALMDAALVGATLTTGGGMNPANIEEMGVAAEPTATTTIEESLAQRPPAVATGTETAPNLSEATEAGKTQQAAAERIRQSQGAETAAAKEAARPEGFTMQTGVTESGLEKALSKIDDDIGGETKGLESLRDPELENVRGVVRELQNPSSLDNNEIDAIRDQLDKTIQQQQKMFEAGSSKGTALKYYKQIKKAFDEEMYSQVPDQQAAQTAKATATQYAQTVARQTRGPASDLFTTDTPEQVIKKVNSGKVDSTTMHQFLVDKTPEEIESLQKAALRDLKEGSTSHGEVNYEKMWDKFDKQRESGKILYGDKFGEVENGLRENAKFQNLEKIIEKSKAGSPGKATNWNKVLKDFDSNEKAKTLYGKDYGPVRADLAAKAVRETKLAEKAAARTKAVQTAKRAAITGAVGGVVGTAAGATVYELLK